MNSIICLSFIQMKSDTHPLGWGNADSAKPGKHSEVGWTGLSCRVSGSTGDEIAQGTRASSGRDPRRVPPGYPLKRETRTWRLNPQLLTSKHTLNTPSLDLIQTQSKELEMEQVGHKWIPLSQSDQYMGGAIVIVSVLLYLKFSLIKYFCKGRIGE